MRARQRIITALLVIAICLTPFSALAAGAQWTNPLDYSLTDSIPDEITATIEIPAGSIVKYETDAATGLVIANRFQSMPVTYPANYGSLNQTIGGDGDPLDVLVLTREPLVPGATIAVRPVGVLMMTDSGEADEKIIAVPVSGVDPTYDSITTASDLPKVERDRIEAFFEYYKLLPKPKNVVVSSIGEVAAAKALVKEAYDRHQTAKADEVAWVHPFDFAQAENAPAEINVVIEIPAGSFTKYEINADNGNLVVDRFQSMPVAYPTNYGSIIRSIGGDGDPLDALVISREPLQPGSIVTVRPVGYLKMVDGGEADEKIVAVPTSDVDPTYDEITTITDLPAMELNRIEAFFEIYKKLPKPKVVEVTGFAPVAEATTLIKDALDRYTKEAPAAGRAWASPVEFPQVSNYPEEMYAVIEIPSGSFTKYEYDAATGILIADRFQSMSVQYPADYGSIVQSKGEDGDPLDVLVLSRQPMTPGAVVLVRPVGVLNMVDNGDPDYKIVAVPTTDTDPTYDSVKTLADLPAIEQQRIEKFFQVYKQLPASRKTVATAGFGDVTTAKAMVKDAVDAYMVDAAADVKVTVNGAAAALAPIAIVDGQPLVGIRAFAEKLGATVTWTAATQTVKLVKGSTTATVQVGSDKLVVNGVTSAMTAAIGRMSGKTMIALSDLATALGVTAQWDAAARTITIR